MRHMHLRNRHLLLLDAVLLLVAPLLAYAARFEGFVYSPQDSRAALVYALTSVALKLSIYLGMGLYTRLWRRAGIADIVQLVWAHTASAAACAVLGIVLLPITHITAVRVPISVVLMDALFTMTLFTLPRLLAKALANRRHQKLVGNERRVLIAGAGAAGEIVAKELLQNPHLGLVAVGFVDDDVRKQGKKISDLKVLGGLLDIPRVAKQTRADELVVAMPRASGTVVRAAVRAAMDAGLSTRTVPGMFEILSGRAAISTLRKVEIQDLLRREPVTTDLNAVNSSIVGRTVLVTGAGGSIGSELCSQLAALAPSRIVMLGHGENSIFDIANDLRSRFPDRVLVPVIADVRDGARIRRVFDQYSPAAVFHAAAHKHVPLMEDNLSEAITNNVLGTRNVVEASVLCGCERFILISTDKAVRPTSVMGATKRVAELVVQNAAITHGKNFLAVRFGNVLGSRGSVVPIFLRQIERGGPVTITDREMTRFFMTIPEAVQLVLQASVMGNGGEVFALDMGEAVRIMDLASDLIRLSGLEVGVDIEIQVTGKRPGEKLFEEVFFRGESVTQTSHPKLLRALLDHPAANTAAAVTDLIQVTLANRSDAVIREKLMQLVPDYSHPKAELSLAARTSQWMTAASAEGTPREADARGIIRIDADRSGVR